MYGVSRRQAAIARSRPEQRADMSVSPWSKQSLARLGGPPFRFSGRRLSRHCRGSWDAGQLEISVFERQRGGFVLSLPRLENGEIRQDAINFKAWLEAIEVLEGACKIEPPHPGEEAGILDVLAVLHRSKQFQQHFAILVGQVLNDWDLSLAKAVS